MPAAWRSRAFDARALCYMLSNGAINNYVTRHPQADLRKVTIGPFWLDPKPFPRDPNAPPSPSDRAPRPLGC